MDEPYVPIEELAKHLSVSVSTIRSWIRQGHITKDTYLKIGNTYRFNVSKVVAALANADENVEETPEAPEGAGNSAPKTPVQLELDFNDPNEDM
jgi:hypothetical protein